MHFRHYAERIYKSNTGITATPAEWLVPNGVGVCSVCANALATETTTLPMQSLAVSFCDFGAKEDGSCHCPPASSSRRRLVSTPTGQDVWQGRASPRRRSSISPAIGFGAAAAMADVPYRGDVDGPDGGFGDNPSLASHELCERRRALTKQLDPHMNELLQVTASSELPSAIVDILNPLLPSV